MTDNAEQSINVDVAIIGGGPAGSTCGTLLKKYRPELSVAIFEKERFPRDHVGESQLPPLSRILDEMGCWDKVEAAEFPIKIGATFRWGKEAEPWDFEFLPLKDFKDEPRPSKYEGQRVQTAFQVDRAVYDTILLDHAAELGCDVYQETHVADIHAQDDCISSLELRDGRHVTAKYYVDASGHIGIMRRKLDVNCDYPTRLQNIAIWDYWQNTDWATEIGVGATRVQVMSLPHGWIWFIPLGPTRTSIGFICPTEHYKSLKQSPEQIYLDAVNAEPRVKALCRNGTRENNLQTTTDWSFLADRAVGENWFLVGEACGFADPILAAGMTLAQTGARELAYTIIALEKREHDRDWLTSHYETNQRNRIQQHIRFADYWYAANGQFTDLQEHCAAIAKDAGLRFDPAAAWRWLAQGGFTNDEVGQVGIGGLDLTAVKHITQMFSGKSAAWQLNNLNVLKLNLHRAQEVQIPLYANGEINAIDCYVRDGKKLPLTGVFRLLVDHLYAHERIDEIYNGLRSYFASHLHPKHVDVGLKHAMQTLEVMIGDRWVIGKLDKKLPRLGMVTRDVTANIHPNEDKIDTQSEASLSNN